jgi:hypothetical protein
MKHTLFAHLGFIIGFEDELPNNQKQSPLSEASLVSHHSFDPSIASHDDFFVLHVGVPTPTHIHDRLVPRFGDLH